MDPELENASKAGLADHNAGGLRTRIDLVGGRGMNWICHMALTWLHIAVGIGIVAVVAMSLMAGLRWYDSIQDQIEEQRKER